MEGNGRGMFQLSKNGLVAFADSREILLSLRKTDARMKGGRITHILQLRPDLVIEGVVMDKH